MNKQKRILVGGILSAALVIGGTATFATMDAGAEASPLSSATTGKMITVQQAKEAALKEAKGTIDDVDLEKHNGKTFYEVDIEQGKTDVTVKIDAYTGKVLDVYKDTNDDDYDDNESNENVAAADVKISLEKATQIALKELKNSKAVSTELDLEDGRYEYDVELENATYEADVTIDANTGKVLSVDIDSLDND
ncbi:PepSY domain-containing protein [Paenibacillus sp. Marseille-Q4541]|uniref:PepSY domain-containing protein n=1 Tax=Paenibacillus sp. Marseille-Q4541 TaxID=2831522 RepID=UPI001BA9D0F8|nr:PepSY domain-containing protein [Paenibacillus sp. Marseille-Q4541]